MSNYLSPQIIEHKKTTTFAGENSGSFFRHTQKCGTVLPIFGTPILSILIIGSQTAIQMIKIIKNMHRLTTIQNDNILSHT
jgi:hypothetical protein